MAARKIFSCGGKIQVTANEIVAELQFLPYQFKLDGPSIHYFYVAF